jgi:hypothetical protein
LWRKLAVPAAFVLLGEVQPGVFAVVFDCGGVAGSGSFDLGVERAEEEIFAAVFDLGPPLVAAAADASVLPCPLRTVLSGQFSVDSCRFSVPRGLLLPLG